MLNLKKGFVLFSVFESLWLFFFANNYPKDKKKTKFK